MKIIVEILLFIVLGIIVFQDMKFRAISWVLIPALCVLLFVKSSLAFETENLLSNVIINCSFVIVQLVLLTIYISFKNSKMTNIINTYLGIGDILFFIAISIAFSPLNYILFYVLSLTFTMFFFVAYKTVKKNASQEIPLAGSMAAMLILLNALSMIQPQFNYSGDILLSTFINQ